MPSTPHRRGTVLVAVVIAMILLGLVVATAVMSGTRDGDLTVLRVQGTKAQYAADAAVAMAVKEVFDNIDGDGNGTVGSISNSSLVTAGTALAGMTMSAAASTSGSTTTITARGTGTDTRRAMRVNLAAPVTTAATILFVVVNSGSLDAQESAKKSLMESWGYTVVPISESASAGDYATAALTSSVCYVSETAVSTNVSTKLTAFTIGVVTEESSISDELGMSTSMTTFTGAQIDIINTSHYITSTLASGVLTIFSAGQPVRYLSGTLGVITTLGYQPSTTNPTLAVMERGDTLTPNGTAAGRRVYLPFGNTGYDVNSLTADGITIMRRSIEWALLPVSHWKLDDASGSTAADSVGSNPGTLVSAAWATGYDNGGTQCNGVGSYIEVANSSSLQITSALTAAGWMRCDSTSSWPTGSVTSPLVRKGTSEPSNYALQVVDSKLAMFLDDVDTIGIRGNTTLGVGQWYHLAATWDGTTVRLYVNGVLDNTPTARAAPIGIDTRVLNIGGRSGGERFNGIIDDVRLYSRALTAAEVAALAQGERPKITDWTQVDPNN
ncbi:MAG: LamG domain-containing protein [Phycisphaerales bacterium]